MTVKAASPKETTGSTAKITSVRKASQSSLKCADLQVSPTHYSKEGFVLRAKKNGDANYFTGKKMYKRALATKVLMDEGKYSSKQIAKKMKGHDKKVALAAIKQMKRAKSFSNYKVVRPSFGT